VKILILTPSDTSARSQQLLARLQTLESTISIALRHLELSIHFYHAMATPTPVQQLATLQEQVANLQAQVEALQTAARTSRPKPILPDPVKFDGKAYHFDTWLPSIKAKLRVDGLSGALGDEIAQFYYVYDRLESNV
jgi:hypothetical protein